MLSLAARGFGPLKDEVVFVGGAVIELYLAGQPTPNVRATDDVDCVVEAAARTSYHKLEEKLRGLGFRHSKEEGAPICRWEYGGILVDVMPLDGGVLGFSNRWYPEGFEHAVTAELPGGLEIRIFTLPYFIASKLEAFKGRGREDFMGSPDMEDIVTLLDGVENVGQEIERAPASVKRYLRDGFRALLADGRFLDGLQGHLPPAAGPGRAARARAVLEAL